jgi:predicted RNA-binding protein with PUA-like domain
MAYWLMKSEPDVYSIDDLASDRETIWDGVRNYQARNFLKTMNVGDLALFYHSNTKPPGVAGVMEITEAMVIDPSQFEEDNKYFDPQSKVEHPRWHTVKVKFKERFTHYVDLATLKAQFSAEELLLVRKGNRLSVMPVTTEVFEQITTLGESA